MSMQYQGHATVGGVLLFPTSATVNLARNPISPEIVWGGAWKVNYATGHFDPTFTINFPLFASQVSLLTKCWNQSQRNNFMTALIDNGGSAVAFSDVKCQTITLSADAMGTGEVTVSATFTAKNATPSASTTAPGAQANIDGQTPIPAYRLTASANVQGTNISSGIITSFNVTVDNHPFKLYTLSGSEIASDIQLGQIGVTGNFTYYSAGVNVAQPKTGSFTMSGPGGLSITIPSLLITGFHNDITGPNQKPMAAVDYEGFGTPSQGPLQ